MLVKYAFALHFTSIHISFLQCDLIQCVYRAEATTVIATATAVALGRFHSYGKQIGGSHFVLQHAPVLVFLLKISYYVWNFRNIFLIRFALFNANNERPKWQYMLCLPLRVYDTTKSECNTIHVYIENRLIAIVVCAHRICGDFSHVSSL